MERSQNQIHKRGATQKQEESQKARATNLIYFWKARLSECEKQSKLVIKKQEFLILKITYNNKNTKLY